MLLLETIFTQRLYEATSHSLLHKRVSDEPEPTLFTHEEMFNGSTLQSNISSLYNIASVYANVYLHLF